MPLALFRAGDEPRLVAARASLWTETQNLSQTESHRSSLSTAFRLVNEASAKHRDFTRLVRVFSRASFRL